tara:strand:- start:204 stop:485 length:282 start_codon:yes stop_codon:yes gene_type:complete
MAHLLDKIMDLDMARDLIVEKFEDEKFLKKFVKKLNDSVDIPMIGEGTERKVIKAIVEAVVESLKDLDLSDEEELAEKMEKLDTEAPAPPKED